MIYKHVANKIHSILASSLKEKALKGVIWSTLERFSVQFIQFSFSILLARMLMPSDYGVIGMLGIFLALSQSVIDSGFANALIQKKNRNQTDFSTVFYFNIFLGITIYALLFFFSPYIADFFSMPILENVTRVVSLVLFLSSLMIVPNAKLTIEMNFKVLAKVSTFSAILSGLVGLYLAYEGYGVWALVVQMVFSNVCSCCLVWYWGKWRPSFIFSWTSFKSLFSFASKLLITGLYGPIYDNLKTLIIGKYYSATNLGYYSRADSLAQFPSSNLTGIINRVSFPLLSEIQDNDERLKQTYRKLFRFSCLIIFPMMLGLGAIAQPLILVLLTEKWLPSVIFLKLLSFSLIFYPICAYNINLLLVKGAVKTHLKLDILKKIVGVIVLFYMASISIEMMCVGYILTSIFSWTITAHYSGKLIGWNFLQQIKDVIPIFIISIMSLIPTIFINEMFISPVLMIIFDILISIVLFIFLNLFFNRSILIELKSLRKK